MAVAMALTGADQAVTTGAGHYHGFAIRETGSAASAIVKIYDGTSAAGTLVDTISVAAGESTSDWYGPQGIYVRNGLYVDVSGTGVVEGSLRVG